MLHSKAVYRRAVVIPDFLFLGIEPDTLPDDRGFWTRGAPDWKGHFKSDCENAKMDFGCTSAESVLARDLVVRHDALQLWRDVPSHVEALHVGIWPKLTLKMLDNRMKYNVSSNMRDLDYIKEELGCRLPTSWRGTGAGLVAFFVKVFC